MVPIETLMYIRLLILIVEVGTPVLKDTFLEIVKTTFAGCNVDAFLLKYKKDIERLLILKVIAPSQYKIIFPKCGQTDIQEWDISLLCFVLLYCCTLKGKCNKVSDILKKVRLKNLLRTNQDTLKDMLDRNVITQGEFDSLQNNVYIGDIHSMDISLVTKLATFLCKDRNTDIIETLRATLKREIELYHKDLHDLLESNKALIDELCLTKEDYMTVFPDDGSKPNLYKLPDSVLCSVVLKLCRSICSEDVESVRSIRNILLHIPNTRIDAKTYLQYINRIKKHIDYFVELNPKQDSIQVKEHIESILKIELKSQEAVNEHLKKMYFGGHLGDDFPEGILKLIKTEMQDGFQDIRNDIQQTERSIKDKIDHESAKTQQRLDSIEKVLKLLAENKGNAVPLDSRPVAEIHVECENKELQNLAEKAVVDRTNDILNDRISDEQDPETTESLQNFIEQIHSCDAQIKMEKQCIMVFLSFTTMDGLLALIHRYKNGTLQLAVERIAVALEKRMQTRMRFKIELRPDVIEEMLNVKGKPLATISTVSDLKSGPPRLLFKCVSLAGLSNIWELYKTGKVSESLEMISTALSKRLGIGVKLTSYINLDSFEKALADAESCIANSETMTKQIFAEQRHLLSKLATSQYSYSMATKKEKNREKLQLLLRGWTYTMRSVVMKHVHESSLDRYNPWSLDDFLDTKKELVNQALSGQAVKLRMELKRPTVMKEWDVTLLYLILLEGCYPKLQQQYNSLDSDVKQIRIIRNELSHANSLEIEEVSYKKKSCQICEAISKGLTYINDTQYTTEMKTFMEEVTGQVELDTMISQFEDWLEKDPIIKEIEDALPSDEYDIRPTLSRMRKTYHGTTIEPDIVQSAIIFPVESILGAYKATKGYGRYTKLERLVLEGWLKTMRRVVMKHVFDSSPDKDNPLSLDVFLDNNKQLVKKTIAGRSVHDNMLKPPTDIEKWDVTLTCQILLEVCYRSPLIQQHYRNLQSDVRAIKDIRNLLSHIGSFEIEETSYKKMSTQVQKMISDGLSFVDDKEFTEEMNTFMNDVELESLDLDEAKSRFKEKTGIMIDIPLLQKEEEKNEVEEERYLTVNNYYLARRKRVKRRTNRDIDQHQQKFVKLVKQSEEIVNIISQQVEFETALKKEYPTLASEVKRHLKYIQDDRRVLVVAGDPGSGKKSLINLLLGAPILPVGQTPSLVGILKIWKGSLSVISQNESKKTPETKKNQDEAAEFIRNTLFSSVKTGIVTETEVCWPFESELLQDDVDIIVESGLGGETKAIEQHLPSSTAFIYVVDCGRAGGITTDRLRSIRTLQQLEPRRTIVLLNKWDVISSAVEKDCEDRKREIEQEKWSNSEGIVREAWKDIKPEYIMKTSVCQEIGRISPCIGIESDQTERVRAIIYSLLDEGADKIKTWMKSFCVFISKLIETHLSSVGKKQSQLGRDLESYNWIHAEAIAKSATLESEIQKHMEECSEVLSKEIAYHIRTNEFRTKMHNWTNDDFLCSLVDGDESVKHAAITTPFLERLSKIVVTDMKDEFGTFITNVRCGVHSKADVIVNLLKELKSILKNIDSIDSESADKIFDLALSEKNRLSHRLDDILNEALLASIFNSEQLLEPIHALSFIFEKPRKEGEIRLPPTEILKKTADDVIEALDTDKISTAIKEQLQTCKTEINQFATKVFPNITEILIPANKLFLMGTEKYDSMRKTIINVKGQVESFCTGCTSL